MSADEYLETRRQTINADLYFLQGVPWTMTTAQVLEREIKLAFEAGRRDAILEISDTPPPEPVCTCKPVGYDMAKTDPQCPVHGPEDASGPKEVPRLVTAQHLRNAAQAIEVGACDREAWIGIALKALADWVAAIELKEGK